MLCKVLKADAEVVVRPMVWPVLNAGGGHASTNSEAGIETAPAAPDTLELQRELARLKKELLEREAQARQAGFREGQAAARQQYEAELNQALARVAEAIGRLQQERQKVHREAERDLVRLAVAIARKILRREILVDPDAIVGIAKAALEKVELRELVRVRVHPADVAALEGWLRRVGVPERVELLGDPSLERGAVLVETTRGELDASVETQLQEIERGLVDLVERRR